MRKIAVVLSTALVLVGCASQPVPRTENLRVPVSAQDGSEMPLIAERIGAVLARHGARAFLREATFEDGRLSLTFEGEISDEVKRDVVASVSAGPLSPTGSPRVTVGVPTRPAPPAPPPTPSAVPIDVERAGAAARRVMPSVVLLTGTVQGTGFVASSDGYVLTNAHVARSLSAGRAATAQFQDGRKFTVRVVGYVESLLPDIGVVKIEATGLPAVEFADASSLRPKEPLVVIGHPGGYGYWLVTGGRLITAARTQQRSSGTGPLVEYAQLQTEVPSSEGSSGAPFIDEDGRVVGILAGPLPTVIVEPSPAPLHVIWTWKEFLALGHLGSYGIGSEDALKYMRAIIAKGGNLP